MLPTLELGPWQISTYRAMQNLALLVAGMYAFYRLVRGLDQPPHVILRGVALIILAGYLSRYLVRAAVVVQDLFCTGDLSWMSGSSFAGAVAGGSLMWLLYCWQHRLPVGRAFDLGLALPLPLGQVIGRLGCLAAGCCFGRPTTSWLGVYLPNHEGLWAVRYPTQLLAAAANFIIVFTLLIVEWYGKRRARAQKRQNWPFAGFLFLLYLNLYCLKRFVLEFLRGDGIPLLGPVTWVHTYTVVTFLASTVLIARSLGQARRA